ncbi:hypothetical protein FQZ97_1040550 [compost metagenome]
MGLRRAVTRAGGRTGSQPAGHGKQKDLFADPCAGRERQGKPDHRERSAAAEPFCGKKTKAAGSAESAALSYHHHWVFPADTGSEKLAGEAEKGRADTERIRYADRRRNGCRHPMAGGDRYGCAGTRRI